MQFRLPVISSLVITGFIASCQPKLDPPVDTGYNYYPTDTGRYYIYNVDSIWIDCPLANDTFFYQVKETYPSTFTDGMGDQAVNVTRYYRTDTAQSWLLATPDVWWLKRTTTRLEKAEENLRFVKMTYPIDVNYIWNGNAYNSLGAQDYFYGPEDIPFNNGFTNFDSTITVYQKLDTNLIEYIYYTETYARGIGMVHKRKYQVDHLRIDTTTCSPWPYPGTNWPVVPALKRIKTGSIVTYKLVEYGFE